MKTRKLFSRGLLAAGVLMLVSAMAAWACTNLATLNLSESSGEAGATIDVTGSSFVVAGEFFAEASPVEIHWDGAEGPVLATADPDAAGNISATVTIPDDAQPGYHVLVATQTTTSKDGSTSPAYGTPARAAFSVGGTAPEAVAANEGLSPVASTPAETSAGMIALTAILGVAGLGLFGSGLGLFVREVRRREEAVPARVDE